MEPATGERPQPSPASDHGRGLFRSVLGGAGATLAQAFANLRRDRAWSRYVDGSERCGLTHGIIPVPGESDDNKWEMLSIRDEIFVIVTRCDYEQARQEVVPGEAFLELHFTMEGDSTVVDDGFADMAIRRSNMLVCRQGLDSNYTIYCPPGPRLLVSLYLRPHVMVEQFGIELSAQERRINPFLDDSFDGTLMRQLPIHPDVQIAIRQLVDTEFTGMRRVSFIAAKVTELLCLCARDLVSLKNETIETFAFSDRDLQIFDRARKMILANFSSPLTIASLAKAVGTNTNKLKSGFKIIYGMTIFEFANHHRMQHAMYLLSSRYIPISEVAKAVGYRSQASFSTAFKDFFGHLPRDIRRTSAVARIGLESPAIM